MRTGDSRGDITIMAFNCSAYCETCSVKGVCGQCQRNTHRVVRDVACTTYISCWLRCSLEADFRGVRVRLESSKSVSESFLTGASASRTWLQELFRLLPLRCPLPRASYLGPTWLPAVGNYSKYSNCCLSALKEGEETAPLGFTLTWPKQPKLDHSTVQAKSCWGS